jgi:hypothetical protein
MHYPTILLGEGLADNGLTHHCQLMILPISSFEYFLSDFYAFSPLLALEAGSVFERKRLTGLLP